MPHLQALEQLCEGLQPVSEHWELDWDDIAPEPKYEAHGALRLCDCTDLVDANHTLQDPMTSVADESTVSPQQQSVAEDMQIIVPDPGTQGSAAEDMQSTASQPGTQMEIWQQAQKWIELRPNLTELVNRVLAAIRDGQRG